MWFIGVILTPDSSFRNESFNKTTFVRTTNINYDYTFAHNSYSNKQIHIYGVNKCIIGGWGIVALCCD